MSRVYLALGDSMSIDLYPQLELSGRGVEGASSRGVGASSLLYRNDDELWPEFAGRDLAHGHPGLERVDLAADGAVLDDVWVTQLPQVGGSVRESARVVTLTAGGNDLLLGILEGGRLEAATRRAMVAIRELVSDVHETFPEARLVLTTVYDPTDGSGVLPGVSEYSGRLPLELLDAFNDAVRAAAADHERAVLADVHGRFLGHGLSAPREERWYWDPNPIEPGARGASEIRRAWLDALGY